MYTLQAFDENLHEIENRKIVISKYKQINVGWADLKPMQLHWAGASAGPAPWCLGRFFIFSRYSLHSRIQ